MENERREASETENGERCIKQKTRRDFSEEKNERENTEKWILRNYKDNNNRKYTKADDLMPPSSYGILIIIIIIIIWSRSKINGNTS